MRSAGDRRRRFGVVTRSDGSDQGGAAPRVPGKALTLRGFKSFADTTVLDLEPGITVVVGPNGSGKSNIVDAVAWVLGAQGPRTLRGGKMDDVIFAGTVDRPALGRAEVSLTIDNASQLLPIEFSEVTITRTLFRTGESEYAINGAPCRLLDIQDLLSDSGVGRQQHVIVGQGQLDAGPELSAPRVTGAAIIEEAAGVLKYRKLPRSGRSAGSEATEGNLLRPQRPPARGPAWAAHRCRSRPTRPVATTVWSRSCGAIRLHLVGHEHSPGSRRKTERLRDQADRAPAPAVRRSIQGRLRELDV